MESTIFDSDLKSDKLDALISEHPELAVLRHLGEIVVEVEGDMTKEDNRFDAPYQEGHVTGGSIDDVVENLKVEWIPTEEDFKYIEESINDSGSESDKNSLKLIKDKMVSEPRKTLCYDITSAVSPECIDELSNEYVENNRED